MCIGRCWALVTQIVQSCLAFVSQIPQFYARSYSLGLALGTVWTEYEPTIAKELEDPETRLKLNIGIVLVALACLLPYGLFLPIYVTYECYKGLMWDYGKMAFMVWAVSKGKERHGSQSLVSIIEVGEDMGDGTIDLKSL